MKNLILTLTLLIPLFSQAENLSFHLGGFSTHLNHSDKHDYNNSHRLVAVEYKGFLAGHFINSFHEDTFIGGYRLARQRGDFEFFLVAGLSYGYRSCIKTKTGERPKQICPMAVPGIAYTKYRVKPAISLFGPALTLTAEVEF